VFLFQVQRDTPGTGAAGGHRWPRRFSSARSVVTVTYRHPTPVDIADLATNLRQQDINELRALEFTDMLHVVKHCVLLSEWSWAAAVGGNLVCIFGVSHEGAPWMLGTDLVRVHRRNLAREAPRYIRKMLKDHPRLVNRVHAANTVAVAWLRRVGFTLHPATPEPNGAMFHTFEMSADARRTG
jgi:hypothetical protein